jgi:hypothetical protein
VLFELSLIFTDVAMRRRQRQKQEEEERERAAAPAAAGDDAPPLPDPPAAPSSQLQPDAAAADVTAPVTPLPGPVPDGEMPGLAGTRPEPVPANEAVAEAAGETSWERWYGNVSAEPAAETQPAPPSPALTATPAALAPPAPAAAAADDGPLGSGQV